MSTVRRGIGGCARSSPPLVAAERVNCARCGEIIEPGTPWDLGHSDDGLDYNCPEHARCNRATNSNCVTSREW